MLKGIDPRVTPELLAGLARMGHGDTLALVDRNYPAYSAGVPVVELSGLGADEAALAIVSLLALDGFQNPNVRHMLTDDGEHGPALPSVVAALGDEATIGGIARPDFYVEARKCQLIVKTTEDRPYACYLLAKGVL